MRISQASGCQPLQEGMELNFNFVRLGEPLHGNAGRIAIFGGPVAPPMPRAELRNVVRVQCLVAGMAVQGVSALPAESPEIPQQASGPFVTECLELPS